jgi:hypothetical protein
MEEVPVVVEPIATKIKKPLSDAKRKQLEGAREKKANQKKIIEPDSESSDDDTEPVKKKSKVITKSNSGNLEQWGTTAFRTAALVSLAGATFYMQNIYGKKKDPIPVPPEPQVTPVQANMLPTGNRAFVGKSGFSI